MAPEIPWLAVTGVWLLIFLAIEPFGAYLRWCQRLFGFPDSAYFPLMMVGMRVMVGAAVLLCAVGTASAFLQRFT